MDYIMKGGLSDQLRLRKLFGNVCAQEGVDLGIGKQAAILKKFISLGISAGLIKEAPKEGSNTLLPGG